MQVSIHPLGEVQPMRPDQRARGDFEAEPEVDDSVARRRAFLRLAAGAAGAGAVVVATGRPAAAEVCGEIDGGSAALRSGTIQARRGTALEWQTHDPQLEPGELGLETDTGRLKLGKDQPALWSALPYVTDERFDDQVMLDGLPVAEPLDGSESLFGWQPSAPTPDVRIPLIELGRFETQTLGSHGADFVWDRAVGENLIVCFGSGIKMYLPEAFPAIYSEPAAGSPISAAHLTVIQSTAGKVEFAAELVGGQPNANVLIQSYELTRAAEQNPGNPPTRLRTRGTWAVARLLSVPNSFGVTLWLVSGDVEAF
jgi:hypothetical protein